jgi:hypothetical protein
MMAPARACVDGAAARIAIAVAKAACGFFIGPFLHAHNKQQNKRLR